MAIKNFFRKIESGGKKAFSKQNVSSAFRKIGGGLNQASPYLDNTGRALQGVGAISTLSGIGAPAGQLVGLVGAGLSGASKITQGVGNLSKHQGEVMQRNIQRSKPKPKEDNEGVFY
jgi:hypothetical protein